MKTYSYQDCLETAYRINWRIDEVLGDTKFDIGKRWLPGKLSAADSISFLSEEEKRKLTHIEMGAYAHIFKYVEEFIAPKMSHLGQEQEKENRINYEALTNFAAEEIKHMNLFRKLRDRVNKQLGLNLRLLDGEKEVAGAVLEKNNLAVLLLITCIEWFTQYHYLSSIKDDEDLDPLTKRIFKAHWQEEAQHAKMDHMEALRSSTNMDERKKDQAATDLIGLVEAVDGLLQKQSRFDLENFADYTGRSFSPEEEKQIYQAILKVKRWVFLESGLTHPNFQELYTHVLSPDQRSRIEQTLKTD